MKNKYIKAFFNIVNSAKKMPNYKLIAILQFISGILGFVGLPLLIPVIQKSDSLHQNMNGFMLYIKEIFMFFHIPFTSTSLLIFVSFLLVSSLILEAFVQYMIHFSQYELFASLNKLLMNKYKEASWSWLVEHNSGEINHALYNEASGTAHNSFQSLQFLISLFQLVLYGLLTVLLSWKVILFIIFIGSIIMIINIKLAHHINNFSLNKNNIQKKFSQLTQTIQQNKKLLKSFGNFDLLSKDYINYIDGMKTNANLIAKYKQYQKFITSFIFIFIILIMIGFRNILNISIETILVILIIFAKIMPYVQTLISSYSMYMEGRPISESFYQKLDELAKHKENNGHIKYIKGSDIIFKNVTFFYNKTKKVLNEANFIINAYKITAIVGKSGMGKSTILDLILGLYRPIKGYIYYNYISHKDIDYNDFRNYVSYVSQETTLIEGSLYDNLVFGNRNISIDEVENVCKKVLLYDYIKTLPNGLYTEIGENGALLSGGQRQRLAIGRALLAKRDIIILDEATSALDMDSEKQIEETISALKGEITIIIVTHRLEIIKNADVVYKIEDFKLKEVK